MLLSTVQFQVLAKENDYRNTNALNNYSTSAAQKKKIGKITNELTDQRTQNSKKFQKDDGTFEVDEYSTPIHYLDNGQWKDIDNTLQDAVVKDNNGTLNEVLQNKQNNFKVSISKDTTAQNLVELQKDKYDVSWNLSDSQSSQASVVTPDENKLNDEINNSAEDQIAKEKNFKNASSNEKQDAKNILAQNEKVKALKNITSTVIYPNIYENTDLEYTLSGSDVKENIK